ncbi:MAG TPA: type 4a pilus biogenesis protein PilO [Kofleriaceae bacterium]|nr:type 4a pilus biogenesis protein PilO [Kofleriaceae bacterium]
MAQIDASKKSARTAITLAVLGALGLAIVYWQFIYSPLEEEVQQKRASHRKLDKENRDLKEEAKIQSAMLECQPELDALNRQNELMLPAESETVAFMKVLTNLAGTAGLAQGPTKKLPEAQVSAPPPPAAPKEKKDKDDKKKKSKADKEAEKARAEAEAKDLPCWERVPGLKTDQAGKASFVRVPFEIEVRGTFHQLTKYFWLLHEHAKTGRIITVENLTLKEPKATADGMVVTATFVAVGFREADRPAGEGGASGAGAGGKDIMGARAAVQGAAATREGQADVAGEGGAASSSTPPAATPPPGSAPANPAASGAQRLTNPGVSP